MYFDDFVAMIFPFTMGLLGDVTHEVRTTAAAFLFDVVGEYKTDFGLCFVVKDIEMLKHERNYLYRRTTLDAVNV
jgi:hypothetical protein